MIPLVVLAILVAFGFWAWFESREKARVAKGLPRLSGIRLIFGALFAALSLFTGGCTLVFLGSVLQRSGQYIDVPTVLIIGGVPFLICALIWWLTMRRNTGPDPK